MNAAEFFIMLCPHCGVKNRVPHVRFNEAKCGECAKNLHPSKYNKESSGYVEVNNVHKRKESDNQRYEDDEYIDREFSNDDNYSKISTKQANILHVENTNSTFTNLFLLTCFYVYIRYYFFNSLPFVEANFLLIILTSVMLTFICTIIYTMLIYTFYKIKKESVSLISACNKSTTATIITTIIIVACCAFIKINYIIYGKDYIN